MESNKENEVGFYWYNQTDPIQNVKLSKWDQQKCLLPTRFIYFSTKYETFVTKKMKGQNSFHSRKGKWKFSFRISKKERKLIRNGEEIIASFSLREELKRSSFILGNEQRSFFFKNRTKFFSFFRKEEKKIYLASQKKEPRFVNEFHFFKFVSFLNKTDLFSFLGKYENIVSFLRAW